MGFTHMAEMLGYRIEKIEADPAHEPTADVPMFKPRAGFNPETGRPA